MALKSTGATRSDQGNQDSKVISMEAFASRLDPTDAVLDVLMRQMNGGIDSVGRMETKWRERELAVMSDTVGGAGASLNATSIPVANPTAYHLDQIIFDVASGDMFCVDETVGGTATAGQVKVRGKSGTGGITTALSAGAVLIIGPEAHAEGEDVPSAFANNEKTKQTYVFQTDETIKITDIENAEEVYGDKEIVAQRKDKMKEGLKRLCLAYYLSVGGREVVSASGPRRHTMTGLFEYLDGQETDASSIPGGLTLQSLGAALRPTTIYGESLAQKVLLAGQNMFEAICAMPLTALRENSGSSKKWGVTVKTLITPYGELPIVHEPLFSEENGMAGESVCLQRDSVKQVQLKGLPLRHITSTQDKRDVHNIEDIYTGTRGIKMKQVELSRRITGA